MQKLSLVLLTAFAVLLSGCASESKSMFPPSKYGPVSSYASPQSVGTYKVGKPYVVAGKTYIPQERFIGEQEGMASWYGPGFDGRKTANGERFDQNAFTAAHPTLQLPSLVRVTNLDNGLSTVVRVNDRGPFHSSRIIDVSKAVADALGFRQKGIARVRVSVMGPESQALASATKARVDTRGAALAVNTTGSLSPHLAAFYPGGAPAGVQVASSQTIAPAAGLVLDPALARYEQTVTVIVPPEKPILSEAEGSGMIEDIIVANSAPIPVRSPAPVYQMAPIP